MTPATRVALLTPMGKSALATFALIGPGSVSLANQLFRSAKGPPIDERDFRPRYGHFGIGLSDDVVVTQRPGSAELIVEIHCHGGTAMVSALIEQLIARGAVRVPWQEFERAAGYSMIQVEAMEALGQVTAPKGADLLVDQWQGSLDRAFTFLRQTRDQKLLHELFAWEKLGAHLAEPWRVVFFGKPNVGKSSLVNALAGFERAIVSATAGTTRDLLSVDVTFEGWPFRLLDGAGLRDTDDPIEKEGVQRILAEIELADLRIEVVDLTEDPDRFKSTQADLVIGGKGDAPSHWNAKQRDSLDGIVSARTGESLDELIRMIVKRLIPVEPSPGQAIPFTDRQRQELRQLIALPS
ncbi:50S ribosome-binding GTPase [bacterium]|nr:50S ribosome-binding GTPase [bacterium]